MKHLKESPSVHEISKDIPGFFKLKIKNKDAEEARDLNLTRP